MSYSSRTQAQCARPASRQAKSSLQEAVMMISLIWPSPPRGVSCSLILILHFDELRSDDRKVWISSVEAPSGRLSAKGWT